MITSGLIHNVLHYINIPVDIREICVMLAPAFSGLTSTAAYLLAKEIGQRPDGTGGDAAGLWAALFMGVAPGQLDLASVYHILIHSLQVTFRDRLLVHTITKL